MSIFSVSINIYSDSRSRFEFDELTGVEPTRWRAKGARRSPRMPGGIANEWSRWNLKSGVGEATWTIERHMAALRPVLERIASRTPHDGFQVELSIGCSARGTGYEFQIGPADLALMGRSDCELSYDAYEANDDSDDLPRDYPYLAQRGRPSQHQQCVELWASTVDGVGDRRDDMLRILRRRSSQLWVMATRKKEFVGFAVTRRARASENRELDALIIAPDYRGFGHGTRLLWQVMNDSWKKGCRGLSLSEAGLAPEVVALLEGAGWVRTRDNRWEASPERADDARGE